MKILKVRELKFIIMAIAVGSVVTAIGVQAYSIIEADAQARLPNDSVRTETIVNGQVMTADLSNGAVTADKLADNAVTKPKMADNSVGSAEIENDAVTTTEIANKAVATTEIAEQGVTTEDIADGAVTQGKIQKGAVGNFQLEINSVNSPNIVDHSITADDIAEGVIPSDGTQQSLQTVIRSTGVGVNRDPVKVRVSCNEGEILLGGGVRSQPESAAAEHGPYIFESGPTDDGRGWIVTGRHGNYGDVLTPFNQLIKPYAICGHMG